jgi:DNA-binding transcriptional ArsR family regulator
VLDVLSSDTAREVLSCLHEDPAAASEVADRLDTSLQTAHYHLDNMAEAGVVESVETVYSEKGREMKVYAPAHGPIVVVGDSDDGDAVREALRTLSSAVGVLAVASLLVQQTIGDGLAALWGGGETGGDGGGQVGVMTQETPAAAAASAPEPGVLVFLGGLVVLAVAAAVWYAQR